MSAPIPVLPVYTQPVGAPPRDGTWASLLGKWIKNPAAEQVKASIPKRPPGATPKGEVRDYINGLWTDKPAANWILSLLLKNGKPRKKHTCGQTSGWFSSIKRLLAGIFDFQPPDH